MSATSVGFLTPITYRAGDRPPSFPQIMVAVVDEYFYLRGQVAVVVSGKRGIPFVRLQPGQPFGLRSILKVMSYTAYFFNLLITTQFPVITTYRRVVQFQMVLSYLPIFMFIAKVVLRSIYRFRISSFPSNTSEFQQQQDPTGDTKTEKSERPVVPSTPKDLIPEQVKATLDNLFGGSGSVDRLPVYQGDSGLE